jgi:hypothetical protein
MPTLSVRGKGRLVEDNLRRRLRAPSGRWKNRHLSLVTIYDDRPVFARIERVVSSPACPAALQLMAKFITLFVDGGNDQSGIQP